MLQFISVHWRSLLKKFESFALAVLFVRFFIGKSHNGEPAIFFISKGEAKVESLLNNSFKAYAVFLYLQLHQDFLSVWLIREYATVPWAPQVSGTVITPLCVEDFIYAERDTSVELGQQRKTLEDSGYRLVFEVLKWKVDRALFDCVSWD